MYKNITESLRHIHKVNTGNFFKNNKDSYDINHSCILDSPIIYLNKISHKDKEYQYLDIANNDIDENKSNFTLNNIISNYNNIKSSISNSSSNLKFNLINLVKHEIKKGK